MEENCDGVSIHRAAAEGRGGWCEELLAKGEDVNSMDQLGWTPLMHAVHNGHTELARGLISRGAHVSHCNHHGITAFTMATLKFDEDLLIMLYDGLLPELKQQESNMALMVACVNDSYDSVQWLLQSTLAHVNYVSPLIGVTPLVLVAMSSGDCDIAELLLNSGADPSTSSALGQDVSELALATGNGKLFSLLNPASPTLKNHFSFQKVKNTNPDSTDPMFTTNQMHLDVQSDKVLKNSPRRLVFKTGDENLAIKTEDKSLLSPSMRSVFLLSPQRRLQSWDCDELNCQYNLAAIVTPHKFAAKTPSKGRKRKLSTANGISSWFKKMTKRRSKSLADEDDYDELNIQRKNGVDFLKLLKDLGLEEFFPIFKEQELDIWTFLSLTVQDLAAMGIDKASSQIRILAGIQALRTTQIE